MRVHDRVDAGRRLAAELREEAGAGVVVLGLPRGGVPVAAEVARELQAPLDVLVVRKLGVPQHRELAMGAIGEGGVEVVDREVLRAAGVGEGALARVEPEERAELTRRAAAYRAVLAPRELRDHPVVIVDDGMATGSTALAACAVARARGAIRVVVAVPVASTSAARALGSAADRVVALAVPPGFGAVGQFYDDFSPTTDEEVVRLLRDEADRGPNPPRAPA
ncbi:MAG: phosphoribosyltransferase [Microthrixaceae bacterium]